MLLLGGLAACGFSVDGGLVADAPVDQTQPDTPIDALPFDHSLALVVNSSAGVKFFTQPFSSAGMFDAPCPQTAMERSRALLMHPTLDYAYSVADSFNGLSTNCGISAITSTVIGDEREVQRIVLDGTSGVGFFTFDGAGSLGVTRFTVDANGVPTPGATSESPGVSGSMDADFANRRLYLGGIGSVWSYPLSTTFTLTANSEQTAGGCLSPVDVFASGSNVYLFCSDTDAVSAYSKAPFTALPSPGNVGAVDAVRSLTPTRVVAARVTPPTLAIVDLAPTQLTIAPGPTLPARAVALSVSRDGKFVAAAVQTSADASEILVWSVSGTVFTQIATTIVPGNIMSLAIIR